LKTILGIPCFGCRDIDKCGSKNETNPENCIKLTNWLHENIHGTEPVKPDEPPQKDVNGLHICHVCGKELPSERGMKIHITRIHNKPKS